MAQADVRPTPLQRLPRLPGGLPRRLRDAPRPARSGVPVLLFPEGGRQQNGFVADFKVGAIKLAVDTGAPIVPTAVVGGSEAMPKGTSWPVPGRRPVRVIVGAPVLAQPGESRRR
ncbi:1-acyl-sn-glycerol-3-phosphate acyltransferase [Brevibacterium casei]|nr:1-acyl-sn-glycerol-3-phosphate acyltransferase [Brevibacterium casei]